MIDTKKITCLRWSLSLVGVIIIMLNGIYFNYSSMKYAVVNIILGCYMLMLAVTYPLTERYVIWSLIIPPVYNVIVVMWLVSRIPPLSVVIIVTFTLVSAIVASMLLIVIYGLLYLLYRYTDILRVPFDYRYAKQIKFLNTMMSIFTMVTIFTYGWRYMIDDTLRSLSILLLYQAGVYLITVIVLEGTISRRDNWERNVVIISSNVIYLVITLMQVWLLSQITMLHTAISKVVLILTYIQMAPAILMLSTVMFMFLFSLLDAITNATLKLANISLS